MKRVIKFIGLRADGKGWVYGNPQKQLVIGNIHEREVNNG